MNKYEVVSHYEYVLGEYSDSKKYLVPSIMLLIKSVTSFFF